MYRDFIKGIISSDLERWGNINL